MTKQKILAAIPFLLLTIGLAAQQSSKRSRVFHLSANSTKFWQLIDREAKLTTMASGLGFTEGPVWDAKGFLYVSDEEQNKIYRIYPDGRREVLISLRDPDGNTYDQQLRLIDADSGLRAIVSISAEGKYSILADRYEGRRLNSPNDVVIGPDGAIYFTDPNMDLPKGEKQELPLQGVFRLGSNGDLKAMVRDMAQPNGLAFSPDGKSLYVDDSERRDIRQFDVEADGKVTHEREFGHEIEEGQDGVPDGMRVDLDGNLFVTGPRGIWVWNRNGQHIGTIELPEQPANLTWGGKDYRTLYITATHSVYTLRTKTEGFVPYLRNGRTISTK